MDSLCGGGDRFTELLVRFVSCLSMSFDHFWPASWTNLRLLGLRSTSPLLANCSPISILGASATSSLLRFLRRLSRIQSMSRWRGATMRGISRSRVGVVRVRRVAARMDIVWNDWGLSVAVGGRSLLVRLAFVEGWDERAGGRVVYWIVAFWSRVLGDSSVDGGCGRRGCGRRLSTGLPFTLWTCWWIFC
jgi:hypothetical protein